MGKKVLVFSLKPMCSFEIHDLDCFIEQVKVEEPFKRERLEVRNARIGITSPSFIAIRERTQNRGKTEILISSM